ncbi:MAG: hypothetical protein HEP71_20795 [Roseivirga sp.]|nr:hypothetical protein [Roseivirga sp.]
MKRNLNNRLVIILIGIIVVINLYGQQDTTELKFSEETLEEPANKNMKWVRVKPGQYNMDNVMTMFKIGTSPLYSAFDAIASSNTTFILDLGYQKKIPKTQFSIEAKIRSSINLGRGYANEYYSTRETTNPNERIQVWTKNYANIDLILRYQPFKAKSIAHRTSGDNLYGFYLLAGGLNLLTWQKENEQTYRNTNQLYREVEKRGIGSGPVYLITGVGYQQRFFKKAYVDIGAGVARRFGDDYYIRNSIYLDLTVGYSIFKVKE